MDNTFGPPKAKPKSDLGPIPKLGDRSSQSWPGAGYDQDVSNPTSSRSGSESHNDSRNSSSEGEVHTSSEESDQPRMKRQFLPPFFSQNRQF